MRSLPIAGSRVTGVRPGFTIHVYTDGEYIFVLEAPIQIQIGDRILTVDPTSGSPDEVILQQLVGEVIEEAWYSDDVGLQFVTGSGMIWHVAPIESFESWQCVGAGFYAVGIPSDTV